MCVASKTQYPDRLGQLVECPQGVARAVMDGGMTTREDALGRPFADAVRSTVSTSARPRAAAVCRSGADASRVTNAVDSLGQHSDTATKTAALPGRAACTHSQHSLATRHMSGSFGTNMRAACSLHRRSPQPWAAVEAHSPLKQTHRRTPCIQDAAAPTLVHMQLCVSLAHCASLCCFPARTHRAGQAGRAKPVEMPCLRGNTHAAARAGHAQSSDDRSALHRRHDRRSVCVV